VSECKVKPVVFNMTDGSVLAINGADSYRPGGAALYWMVRYYFRNPGKRANSPMVGRSSACATNGFRPTDAKKRRSR
jgi:hypothetical protein